MRSQHDYARKYTAHLTNDQGCIFDQVVSDSIVRIKAWAKDRSGSYALTIRHDDDNLEGERVFKIKNNRLCEVVR